MKKMSASAAKMYTAAVSTTSISDNEPDAPDEKFELPVSATNEHAVTD
jgi:hypothetical protein